ncbi:MAG: DUF493 family protein, partial [Rhodothermales bacterium]|nr:DUF493 family protein [Rhodothermales bacterium]
MSESESTARDAAWWANFRRLLDDQNTWPAAFPMKFIVPADQVSEAEARFASHILALRPSSKGAYVSVSLEPVVASADEVVALY